MNSVHDIGGMDGFGPVCAEPDEPVFHEPWEGRVFAMRLSGAGRLRTNTDAGRYQMERMDPVQYLTSSYYERWLARFEIALIEAGILTRDEVAAKIREFAENPDAAMPRRDDPTGRNASPTDCGPAILLPGRFAASRVSPPAIGS